MTDLSAKLDEHDPELVASLLSLRAKLEAMPEPLRGPFVVEGLAPYLPSSSQADSRVLPCDVQLPPATTISKGASLQALMKALETRGMTRTLAQQALRTTEAGEVVAWRDVLAERQRQIATEGWTPDHDDEHDKGELAKAAGVYALAAASHDYRYALQGLPVNDYLAATFKMWPWHWGWFKPKDRRRDCVKAAALLLAEIERLDRAALSALEHQP